MISHIISKAPLEKIMLVN